MRFYDREQEMAFLRETQGMAEKVAEIFLGATHQFKDCEIGYEGLSMEDM